MNLSEATFTQNFTQNLPEGTAYSFVESDPAPQPKLLAWSNSLAKEFHLETPTQEDIALLAGNREPKTAKSGQIESGAQATTSYKHNSTYAVRYGGHQFGRWAGQLGDGRAITFGELKNAKGEPYEFQLKGSGPTPYSRRADGRAVLRSSLREFIASEAMHALRVPSTRSLSLIATGHSVERDMFYDGNPQYEPGAITSRQAPTFVRFGNFEILAANNEHEALKKLTTWTIKNHFKFIDLNSPDAVGIWFREVCERTAKLMVEWLRVGFVHGVMNTDNMSILGLTIDYGPFGFIDSYEPDFTPNTTDLPGRRYCFGRQAPIALWNCERLGDAIQSLVPDPSLIEEGLKGFITTYETQFLKMMAGKLGLKKLGSSPTDLELLTGLDQTLQATPTDMTLFYRGLTRAAAHSQAPDHDLYEKILPAFYETPTLESEGKIKSWLNIFTARVAQEEILPDIRRQSMEKNNPWIIPRNYILFNTIQEAEKGHLEPLQDLIQAIQDPYKEDERYQALAQKRPDWAKTQPGSSTLSCSS